MKARDEVSLVCLLGRLRRRLDDLLLDDFGLEPFQPRSLLYKLLVTRLNGAAAR